MDYLPVFFSLKERDCLVVGGGAVARRKVDLLLRAGARVTVGAPQLEPTLAEQAREGQIRHLRGLFEPSMLEGMTLVISATEKKAVNRDVAAAAEARNVPVNVVDDPELCRFILPAIVERSPVVIAVSSGGKSPVLARLLKARLESLVPVAYGRLAALAGEYRERVKAALGDPVARRKFWERNFQGEVAHLYLAGREQEARAALESALQAAIQAAIQTGADASPAGGSVSFVTADGADPELLTLKALRYLQEADVLVHDPAVPPETLAMARRDAERILCGAEPGRLCHPADDVPALLIRLAKAGQHVLRIRVRKPPGSPAQQAAGSPAHDADPTGDGEALALQAHGIAYRIIPAATA